MPRAFVTSRSKKMQSMKMSAEAFVEGRTAAFSPHLCLRAPMLQAIRDFNSRLPNADRVRVHLTDIDSPAAAIRQHLDLLTARLHADQVTVPAEPDLLREGPGVVSQLAALPMGAADRGALRTIAFSIQALGDLFQVDTGHQKAARTSRAGSRPWQATSQTLPRAAPCSSSMARITSRERREKMPDRTATSRSSRSRSDSKPPA